jgi:hypothetical protein
MTTPQVPHSPAAILLTPECEASGCHVAGDQYTMIRCRGCGGWFCNDHIDAQEGVTLIHLAPQVLRGLAYYQGICQACR